MRKRILSFIMSMLVALTLLFGLPNVTWADSSWYPTNSPVSTNSETRYEIYLDDWADLLTDSEESQLLELMEPISAYGNVAFVSIDSNPTYSTERYAEHYYEDHFGYQSGTIFLVDMDERYIWIHSYGEIYRTVTTAYANTITDNVYSYASRGDYLSCAGKAFEQINTLLEGRAIAQPMKYISNALLAIVLALLINYFLVMTLSRSRKATDSQLINGTFYKANVINPHVDFIRQTKRYSPQDHGGGGGHGGGGHGGGGHGGGGGHSGGGGGHRF